MALPSCCSCSALVTVANRFGGELRISAGANDVNGKSILELMTLNACCGTELEIRATGEGAELVLDELEELVQGGFGEELQG